MNSRIWALGVVMLAANPALADDNTVPPLRTTKVDLSLRIWRG